MSTSTNYLSINAVQRPTSISGDSSAPAVYSFNFNAEGCNAAPGANTHIVANWCRDLIEICLLAGINLTLGTDTFNGARAVAPNSATVPLVTYFIDTGGRGTSRTHGGGQYEWLSAQVYIRGAIAEHAYTHAMNIYRALDGLYNLTVSVG